MVYTLSIIGNPEIKEVVNFNFFVEPVWLAGLSSGRPGYYCTTNSISNSVSVTNEYPIISGLGLQDNQP